MLTIEKKEMIYSGKAKTLFETNEKDLLVAEFRDDTTAFDGIKCEQLANKGKVNNYINAYIMEHAEKFTRSDLGSYDKFFLIVPPRFSGIIRMLHAEARIGKGP